MLNREKLLTTAALPNMKFASNITVSSGNPDNGLQNRTTREAI